ncbi:MAG: hypothetical protein OXB84_09285 [Halobacteriovoraceae bacterium]|nr:hypothetical protein [Halobacteriovoraceae bacterium]
MHRLYIFTGKGGVGKTTISLAFTRYLKNQGRDAVYCPFDQDFNPLSESESINILELDKKASMEKYISAKLSSNIIASWIMKSGFFNSMMDMLPSLTYLILLGDLLDRLDKDPELILVLDFPSTGHAMTLFESLTNFKDIFGIGMIVEDIKRMHKIMISENFLKPFIISLPTSMAFHEAMELELYLKGTSFKNCDLIMNDSFTRMPHLDKNLFPAFLKNRISGEEDILKQYNRRFKTIFHHVDEVEESVVIDQLTPFMGGLL